MLKTTVYAIVMLSTLAALLKLVRLNMFLNSYLNVLFRNILTEKDNLFKRKKKTFFLSSSLGN